MPIPLTNRELSWLEFNQRVLDEALRLDLPLLDRLKFLAITASNLDEFFQVRIGSLMLILRSGLSQNQKDSSASQQLAKLRERILKMTADQYRLLNEQLKPAMEKHGLVQLAPKQLSLEQLSQLEVIFEDQIFPLLTPLAFDEESHPFNLPALQLILACRLKDDDNASERHVFIPIPESLPRYFFVNNDTDNHSYVMVEDLISLHVQQLFSGETVQCSSVFRVTKNGDMVVQEDEGHDLANEMEALLTERRFASSVRLELNNTALEALIAVICQATGATEKEIYRFNGPLALSSYMDLSFHPDFNYLRSEDWKAQQPPSIPAGMPIFEAVAKQDILLFHPYESFDPVLRMIEEAAIDPNVIAIKQVLYRTARKSRIIDALIKAAENGKQVTVLVELKARFDEARNITRADELKCAGAQVVYGVKGLKTHAKICMIVRREGNQLRRYVHLGTGNYNESTAKLYTDFSLLTCKPAYGNDASLFFNAVTGRTKLLRFQRLVPAPTAMKPKLLELIANESERAKQGLEAKIIAKVNSLQDTEIIAALYKASQAGVQIKLNVRGICCLQPGLSRYSKNIEVISVIDRYLEHARVFYFHQGGNPEIFIASADWMTRNLDKRVELMIPIEDAALQRRLLKSLEAYFKDNQQAFRINSKGISTRIKPAKGEKVFRAQEAFYQEAKSSAKAQAHEQAMTFEPHIPIES